MLGLQPHLFFTLVKETQLINLVFLVMNHLLDLVWKCATHGIESLALQDDRFLPHFDGGLRPNPGPSRCGYALIFDNEQLAYGYAF